MKKKVTDQDLDRVIRSVIVQSGLSDGEIDEIADSPGLWRSVRSEIDSAAPTRLVPWPPVKWLRSALVFGVPAVAAAAIVIALFISRPSIEPPVASVEPPAEVYDRPDAIRTEPQPEVLPNAAAKKLLVRESRRTPARRTMGKPSPLSVKRVESASRVETKTEFIALSYARNPDSGQIVRVRVPSSMMVTVGLVQTVEKPADLIDAEVLVGDDGLTRAIRFIRTE